jgi:hypothetical protein
LRIYEKIVHDRPSPAWDTKELEKSEELVKEAVSYPAVLGDYAYHERSDFTLSAHPKLRKFHPDFNPKTGLDHDPVYMQKQVERWADIYLEKDRRILRSLVSGVPVNELDQFQW